MLKLVANEGVLEVPNEAQNVSKSINSRRAPSSFVIPYRFMIMAIKLKY